MNHNRDTSESIIDSQLNVLNHTLNNMNNNTNEFNINNNINDNIHIVNGMGNSNNIQPPNQSHHH